MPETKTGLFMVWSRWGHIWHPQVLHVRFVSEFGKYTAKHRSVGLWISPFERLTTAFHYVHCFDYKKNCRSEIPRQPGCLQCRPWGFASLPHDRFALSVFVSTNLTICWCFCYINIALSSCIAVNMLVDLLMIQDVWSWFGKLFHERLVSLVR